MRRMNKFRFETMPRVSHGFALRVWKVAAAMLVCQISLLLELPVAFGAVPPPWGQNNKKSGRPEPIEALPSDKFIVRHEYDPNREYPEHLKFGAYWQEPNLCGPNALYVLMRLCGHRVSRDQVVDLVPVGEDGASLADLSKAATKLGLNHRLQKVSQRELSRLEPPFLVHEHIRGADVNEPEGHFFVVVRFLEPDQVKIVDGVSGFYQQTDNERLVRSFSGYVLAPVRTVFGIPVKWLWGALYVLGAVIVILGFALGFQQAPHRRRRHASSTSGQ